MKQQTKLLLAMFVLGAVGLNIVTAISMKLLAKQADLGLLFLLAGIGFVVFLNGLRMLVWMFANKHFPLSTMYPLTSIFYPLMLGVSYYFKERITWYQVVGAFFITLGVFWLGWRVKSESL